MLFTHFLLAQESSSIFKKFQFSPLDIKNIKTFCGRDWMGSEKEMDSLKQVIMNFERKLKVLPQEAIVSYSDSLVLLYSYEFMVRNDPWGESNYQLCIDAKKYGSKVLLEKTELGFKNSIISMNNKYLVATKVFRYIGNSEIWTTIKHYYLIPENN